MCARRSRLALCLHLPLQDAGLHPLHFIAWLCCVQRVCSLHPALSTASCIPGCAAAGGLILACLCNSALTAIPNSLRRAALGGLANRVPPGVTTHCMVTLCLPLREGSLLAVSRAAGYHMTALAAGGDAGATRAAARPSAEARSPGPATPNAAHPCA